MLLTNTADGGTATTAVTTANSGGGSGAAWDAVNAGGSGAITFDATHAHSGGLAYKVVADAANNVILTWDTALGGSQTELWGRLYVFLDAVPANNIACVWLRTSSNVNVGRVRINPSGGGVVLDVTDGSNTVVQAGTVAVAIGQWVRIEWHAIASTTAGTLTATLYNSADSTSASETVGASGTVALGAAAIDRVHYGRVAASSPPTFWLDDLGVSNTGALGPSQTAGAGSIAATAAASGTGTKHATGTATAAAAATVQGAGAKHTAGAGTATATATLTGVGAPPVVTVPEVPVFLPGVPVGNAPAEFNAKIKAPFTGLLAPPVFVARRTGALTVTEATRDTIEWDTVDEDPYGGWSAGTPGRWVVPAGWYGWWSVTCAVSLAGTGASGMILMPVLVVDSFVTEGQEVFVPTGGGQAKSVSSSWWVYAAADQPVELALYFSAESSITAVDTTPGMECRVEIVWDGV